MFATILGLPDFVVTVIVVIGLVIWALKDLFRVINGPVSRGIWDQFRRGR